MFKTIKLFQICSAWKGRGGKGVLDLQLWKYDLKEFLQHIYPGKVGQSQSSATGLDIFSTHAVFHTNFGMPGKQVDLTWMGSMPAGSQEYFRLFEAQPNPHLVHG